MKTQFLTTIEFRYNDAPKYDDDNVQHLNKIVTLGVFDTIQEAQTAGNKVLELLESNYKLNPNYNIKQRLGLGRYNKNLITDLGYIKTPFSFYLKITELKYNDLEQVIIDATESIKRYKQFKISAE